MNRAVIEFLSHNDAGVPFFCYVHYMDPHYPYQAAEKVTLTGLNPRLRGGDVLETPVFPSFPRVSEATESRLERESTFLSNLLYPPATIQKSFFAVGESSRPTFPGLYESRNPPFFEI